MTTYLSFRMAWPMTPVEEAIAALEGLVAMHDGFMKQTNGYMGNQADAYYQLGKRFAEWDKARQALSRLRANGEGWRPISEHDGSATPVDLWMSLGWRVTNAYWAEYDDDEGVGHTWLTEDGGWIEGEDCRATHFKPLPDPPK